MFRVTMSLAIILLAFGPLTMGAPLPIPKPEQASSAGLFHGVATWFRPNLGACGEISSEKDYMIAMNSAQYKSGGPCHKNVVIRNKSNGKSVVAKVLDECPSCRWGSLDLSPSAFKALGKLEDGVLPIAWKWT
ncbi:hypothetical protein PtA15_6A251 [Puccinia triticina]|uniref:RlpA-like protein double-psi beta-barrel domain-containing protein n=1 Tax=Puccinia triticina TaxID=208348 RepID=A0ABY7CL22_9BASI|nr:uncharacterized protein PtA15_6A251 [Puccinia triticina]WAQ85623.1 hypothetical protein PtA15_6A251 [Puccinia triticina]WAR55502.1 hypothetical protein PtB15_6B243 [Puccinia triticina]